MVTGGAGGDIQNREGGLKKNCEIENWISRVHSYRMARKFFTIQPPFVSLKSRTKVNHHNSPSPAPYQITIAVIYRIVKKFHASFFAGCTRKTIRRNTA